MTGDRAMPARRAPIFLCLGLILVYPLFSVPVQHAIAAIGPRLGGIDPRIVTEAAIWLYGAIVLAIALFWERRTLASIGLRRPSLASLGFGIGGALAITAAGALAAYVVYGLLHQPKHADAQAAAMVGGSVVYAICLAVRAGVIEEIFYRGLGIEQLTALTKRRWLAALIPTVAFVVMHALRFDWIQLVPIAAVAIVLVALYLWRHDLWSNIFAHVAVDAFGLVQLALQAHK
jgi:membrane protease YdiL (CAAX protease family)